MDTDKMQLDDKTLDLTTTMTMTTANQDNQRNDATTTTAKLSTRERRIPLTVDDVDVDAERMSMAEMAAEEEDHDDTRPSALRDEHDDQTLTCEFDDTPAVLEEQTGQIQYRVVNNDGARESTLVLTGLKCLFQTQLPKMPKEYIARLVYDRAHQSLALVRPQPLEVLGGLTFRVFLHGGGGGNHHHHHHHHHSSPSALRFAEIVFCAIASNHQIRGYGAHLMAHFKDYVRAAAAWRCPPVMHLLTYADNHATGYFQKQGFSRDLATTTTTTTASSLPAAVWRGRIKDYDGGTLMHCALLPRIRYLAAPRMLRRQRHAILVRLLAAAPSRRHVVHAPPRQWASSSSSSSSSRGAAAAPLVPIDPLSVPAIRDSGWTPAMDALSAAAAVDDEKHYHHHHHHHHQGPHFAQLGRVLAALQAHKQAWPFLQPVSAAEVPDYYAVVRQPIDLSAMQAKLARGLYGGDGGDGDGGRGPRELVADLELMFANCRLYNGAETVYFKCAARLEKYMWNLVREVPGWLRLFQDQR